MPEAAFDIDKRVVTRFRVRTDLKAIVSRARGDEGSAIEVKVVDLSVCGCCVEAEEPEATVGEAIGIRFQRQGVPISSELEAKVRGTSRLGARHRLHLQFEEQQQLVEARHLVADHAIPAQNAMSDRARRSRQSDLATSDLAQIHSAVRDIRSRLFHLGMGALTLLLAAVGAFLGVLNAMGKLAVTTSLPAVGTMTWWWLLSIAAAPVILAPVFMLVASQLQAELLRYGSFAMILQRTITDGDVPPCYRGWEDAFANYNRRWREMAHRNGGVKASEDLPAKVAPLKYLWRVIHRNYLPPDMSYLLCVGLFMVLMPLVGGALITILMWPTITAGGSMNIVVGGALAVVIAMYYFVPVRELRSVYGGARSFDQCLIWFNEILSEAPPYDPYNSQATGYAMPVPDP